MTARERLREALSLAGCKVANGGSASTCPAHEDRAPSLSIGNRRDGAGVVVRCHAGCETSAVLAALGMTEADLFDEPRNAGSSRPQVVATYDYVDEQGALLYQKVRYEPKDFRQRRREGNGWSWKLGDARRVLYRLPEVRAAIAAGAPVFVCEGEKDADHLARAGVTATCWTEGAWKPGQTAKWRREYTEALAGARVAVVRDRDEPGQHTAACIARELAGVAAAVLVLEPAEGKDATDHLTAGRPVEELVIVPDPTPEPTPDTSAGSAASAISAGSEREALHRGIELAEDVREDGEALLDEVRAWLERHITVMRPGDLDVLTLWAAHTHLSAALHTTPRLQVDSPVPESGKTTVLEHLERLCFRAVLASSISSPALLARLLAVEPRTLLLDEVDRTLDPKKEGVGELLSILNSGYKAGATRPTLVPVKDGGWAPKELPTFAPVVMAGNQPNLPDDTRTRIIRVLLLPDWSGRAEESDWELKDREASELGARLARWARHIRPDVAERPQMPPGCTARFREKWQPLARVARVAGRRWLEVVMQCAADDVAEVAADRDAGLAVEKPAVLLLRHLALSWPEGAEFWRTSDLVETLAATYPEAWGDASPFGKPITAQRLGRMLVSAYRIRTTREDTAEKSSPRGYRRDQFAHAAGAMSARSAAASEPAREIGPYPHGYTRNPSAALSEALPASPPEPAEPAEPAQPAERREHRCPDCAAELPPGKVRCGPCFHRALMAERIAKAEAAS